jgi:hypothetical protein
MQERLNEEIRATLLSRIAPHYPKSEKQGNWTAKRYPEMSCPVICTQKTGSNSQKPGSRHLFRASSGLP